MSITTVAIIVFIAVAMGAALQYATRPHAQLHWLITALAFTAGTFVTNAIASGQEATWATGPTADGLVLAPAIGAGLVAALVADAISRYVTTDDAPAAT